MTLASNDKNSQPASAASAASSAAAFAGRRPAAADGIRQQIEAFETWRCKFALWADPTYLDSLDKRLNEAAATQKSHIVAMKIESMRNEIEVINWASGTLTRKIEIEAKQSTRQAPKKG